MLQKILNRGPAASALLKNKTFQSAITEVKEGLISEWQQTSFKDEHAREKIYLSVRALDDVINKLDRWIGEAEYQKKIEKAKAEKKEAKKKAA